VGTGETRLRPSNETWWEPSVRWTGSAEPYKPRNGEVGESGAAVGVARNNIFSKAHLRDRAQAVVYAIRHDLA
jgi:hypothetical protein